MSFVTNKCLFIYTGGIWWVQFSLSVGDWGRSSCHSSSKCWDSTPGTMLKFTRYSGNYRLIHLTFLIKEGKRQGQEWKPFIYETNF